MGRQPLKSTLVLHFPIIVNRLTHVYAMCMEIITKSNQMLIVSDSVACQFWWLLFGNTRFRCSLGPVLQGFSLISCGPCLVLCRRPSFFLTQQLAISILLPASVQVSADPTEQLSPQPTSIYVYKASIYIYIYIYEDLFSKTH